MFEDGPVRKVLRADIQFEKLRVEAHKWNGLRHDLAMGALCLFVFGGFVAAVNPWTALVSAPLLFLIGYFYRCATRRYRELVEETEEAFAEYHAVLEDSLVRETPRTYPSPQTVSARQH